MHFKKKFCFQLFLKLELFYSTLSTEHDLYYSLSQKILCLTQDADFVISFSGVFGKTEQPNVFLMKNLSASFDESESEIKIEYLAKIRQKTLKI